ncbi:MAG: MoxR family ATPase [Chromatiales bacterium]|jgi:MoxR-like ATPase|nr:MoxR family ATPase [Chromatiales bacterium]
MNTSIDLLRVHIERSVIGQARLTERLLIGLLSGGHLLIEGVPGLAKTTAVRTLASGLALGFHRIQFTPDMIPGDITGTDIFIPRDGSFQFAPGPIFSEIVLADEINRAPPKVQSALLEAMQERQVTVGGVSRPLPSVFMVIATQNPLEQEGTYPLPEAQLDRFQMKIRVDYPSAEEELAILRLANHLAGERETAAAPLQTMTREQLDNCRRQAQAIYLDEMLERYIVELVGVTRAPARRDETLASWISHGASPRATLALAHTARARAWLSGRDFVEPDDIIELAPEVLSHRIGLTFAARAAGVTPAQAVARMLECVPIP